MSCLSKDRSSPTLIVMFVSFMVLNSCLAAQAAAPVYNVRKATTAIVVDGDLTEFANAHPIALSDSLSGASGIYKLLWDEQGLYIGLSASDTQLNAVSTTRDLNTWRDDSVEIWFDTGFERGTAVDMNDYRFGANLINTKCDSQAGNSSWDINFTTAISSHGTINDNQDTDTGYTIEVQILWAEWGIASPTAGVPWGLEMNFNDSTESGIHQTPWSNWDGGTDWNPDGWGTALFVGNNQVDTLEWIPVPANLIFNNSINNLVGQLLCGAAGYDVLQSLSIGNSGTARSNEDLQNLKLWYLAGGGPFVPGIAQQVGVFSNTGEKTWYLSLNQTVYDSDALYLTADVPLLAESNRTCQFFLPAGGAQFQFSWPQALDQLANPVAQTISRNFDYQVDFISTAPINVVKGTQNISVGRITIKNISSSPSSLNSLLLVLQNLDGQMQALDTVFERLWLEENSQTVATLVPPYLGSGNFFFVPPKNLPDQATLSLELKGHIQSQPLLSRFRAGIPNNQTINNGQVLTKPLAGKLFPLLTQQVNIREPRLEATFSCYPSPFQAGQQVLHIPYYLEKEGKVYIHVSTLTGRKVRDMVNARQSAGMHEVCWNGRNAQGLWVRSSVYLITLVVDDGQGSKKRLTRKVSLVR